MESFKYSVIIESSYFAAGTKGDEVGFCRNVPDKVYVSIVFKKNAHMFDDLASHYPDTQIDISGSGVDLKKKLLPEIESMKPDYSLYPKNNASRLSQNSNRFYNWVVTNVDFKNKTT